MRFLILAINYAPEPVGAGRYTADMARWLAANGHDVTVVCAQPYYPQWQISEGYGQRFSSSWEEGVRVVRCPLYVPEKPTGARRLLHYASFAASALVPTILSSFRYRPDLVFAVAPTLMAAPIAGLAAQLTGARSWLHVQDLEVDAAFATGLLRSDGAVSRIARAYEVFVLRRFDHVSSISLQMCERLPASRRGSEAITLFQNGVDVEAIKPLEGPSPYRAEWGIKADHVVLYSGSIARKQGLEIVVEAARMLAHRPDVAFVICGNGPNRTELEMSASGLSNICFKDLQPEARLRELLGLATIHVLPQIEGAEDLVLPSKLGNMLASQRPIIATAREGSGIANELAHTGMITEPGDPAGLARSIESLVDDPVLHQRLATAARRRALECWSREKIFAQQFREFQKLLKRPAEAQGPATAVTAD
ncbi:WcaI family glycosyltransferase [Aquamicrobium zhengzhouense]|uniref:WcaI family glycosyltransferase n=1 Tax=Aquamicrobium zhengzhouense TaxID=2781738 RepID=A0ABS0S7E8_9HYPH|nr:WcaI family glycosyltransferase [Aquamicrobium zhengzhouense]MBI1619214.1 WcaI family glycosyltransferase [Aquamicrobium zhengzhouense]